MAKLLIVDDEKNIRASLSAFFESSGHEIRMAQNGEQALQLLSEENNIDLVLSDFRMAEMNGLELLQQIKRESSGPAVVLMTAYATVENAVAAMKSGAIDDLRQAVYPRTDPTRGGPCLGSSKPADRKPRASRRHRGVAVFGISKPGHAASSGNG